LAGCPGTYLIGPALLKTARFSLIVRGRAGVAELADARDSKSRSGQLECGFDSLHRHTVSLWNIRGIRWPDDTVLGPSVFQSQSLDFSAFQSNLSQNGHKNYLFAVFFISIS
jgi:hypothetical protein